MGVFDSLAGSLTINKQTQSPSQRDYGTFDPALPYPPLWSDDGKNRYGFRRWFNGYVYGGEGTSLAQLQAAVNAGKVPGIHPNSAGQYPTLIPQDYYDAMYLAVGQTSLYETYVVASPVVVDPGPGQPDFPPPLPPVVPIDPNPQTPPVVVPPNSVDPCASVKADLVNSNQQISLLQHSLAAVNTRADASDKTLSQITKIIKGLDIPARGGGQAWLAVRKIASVLAS